MWTVIPRREPPHQTKPISNRKLAIQTTYSWNPSRGTGGKVPFKRPGTATNPLRVGGRSIKRPETSATDLSRVRLKDKPPCIADGN
ncbi:hypothetical protein Pmani_012157 [Petrolisthes manimaculis]|uniref:Uncharacterized protein n=1 Tax=Petrolisthes manimaculis TaxID=1843537 RepID=A0AAE1PXY6_9EUCA|nr:hypothetical protein Pmani_012157 [Petrolisthes manimaculis]